MERLYKLFNKPNISYTESLRIRQLLIEEELQDFIRESEISNETFKIFRPIPPDLMSNIIGVAIKQIEKSHTEIQDSINQDNTGITYEDITDISRRKHTLISILTFTRTNYLQLSRPT